MTQKDCKYQCIYQRKSYNKARWLKAWKRYHEREGYIIGKKRRLIAIDAQEND